MAPLKDARSPAWVSSCLDREGLSFLRYCFRRVAGGFPLPSENYRYGDDRLSPQARIHAARKIACP